MANEVQLILQAFLVLIDLLKKDPKSEFKEAWGKDEQIFIKAWKEGDVDTINHLFDKYYQLLQEA